MKTGLSRSDYIRGVFTRSDFPVPGLGLSTVSAIVKNHGGFITVDSLVKRGTTFRVRLPALVAAIQKEEDAIGDDLPLGNGELILLVDDEAAIRDLARTILEPYGYRVLVAADGVEKASTSILSARTTLVWF